MINVCLSHDIDRIDKTYQYITKPLKALKRGEFILFVKRLFSPLYIRHPYWGFDKIIEIEEKYGVRSTCFFLNEGIKLDFRKPKTIKLSLGRYKINDKRIVNVIHKLDQNGWEIGVHGSYLSYNDTSLLKQEKTILEKIVGHEIKGVRQHYLNWNGNTWQIQSEAGFKYDTTWGFTEDIGFKDGHITPFFPIKNTLFCEIPLIVMDSCFDQKTDNWVELENIIDVIDKNDAYVVLNWHNNNFDRLDFPNYESNYIKIIELLKSKNANFMTMGEAYDQIVSKIPSSTERQVVDFS